MKPEKHEETVAHLPHIADDNTLQVLMIGTERGLRDDTAPASRARSYGKLVRLLEILVVGRGIALPTTPIAENVHVSDVLASSYPASLYRALVEGKRILSTPGTEQKWLITTQDPFEIGLVGYVLSRITKTPLHLQVHTDPGSVEWQQESFVNRIRAKIFRFLVKRADGIRVVGIRALQAIESLGVPKEKIHVVPIYTDLTAFSQKPSFSLKDGYPESSHIIVAMGRFSREKGFDVLIRALPGIRKIFPYIQVLLVGKGDEEARLRLLARELDVDRAVKFIPWARDTLAYYRGADVVVVPSRYEGWGLVPVEALAAGGLVVMSDVGCAGEVIVAGETGLVVEPGNNNELRDAIIYALSHPELKAAYAKNAKVILKGLATESEFYRLQRESWMSAFRHGTKNIKTEGIDGITS